MAVIKRHKSNKLAPSKPIMNKSAKMKEWKGKLNHKKNSGNTEIKKPNHNNQNNKNKTLEKGEDGIDCGGQCDSCQTVDGIGQKKIGINDFVSSTYV